MDNSWKNDPRLRTMNPEKLALLTEFADRISRTEKENLMEALLSVNLEAKKRGISFNDSETALLVTILSAHMGPKERKRIELLKMVAQKMAKP
jgi:hypothetical protein